MKRLDKKNVQDILALTPMQEGILFHYLQDSEGDLYFEQLSLELSGHFHGGRFEQAWNLVIETNEMLRAVFRWENVENPVQIILKKHRLKLRYYDFSGIDAHEKKHMVEKIKINDRKEKFHLKEVPFRVTLCKIEKDKYIAIISNHHILYDGWSSGIILKEFFEAYHHLSREKPITKLKPTTKNRFKEFVQWIQLQNENKSGEKIFWKEYLEGFTGEAENPLKKRNFPGIKEKDRYEFIKYQTCLGPGVSRSLSRIAATLNITPAVLFYCAWGVLMQRYCSSEDVLFGTTTSGRSAKIPGIEDMVGLFINTLPLRVQASLEKTIEEIFFQINRDLKERETYEFTPLVVIKAYSSRGDSGAFFDSLVVMENYPVDQRLIPSGGKLSLTDYNIHERTHFDVTISIHTRDKDKIIVDFICSSHCFDEAAVQQMGHHFVYMLEYMVQNPRKRIGEIDILSAKEKKQLLVSFNDTSSAFPIKKVLHLLFEEQVEKTPDNTAVVGPLPIKYRTYMPHMAYISYRELNEKSHQLAYRLQEKGAAADTIVAIMVERSVEMIIAILGILTAGGAYMPIDPEYPEERINYMLADSGAEILVTVPGLAEKFKKLLIVNCQLLIVNEMSPNRRRLNTSPKEANNNLQLEKTDLAYTIYTSGSTGKPKGVLVEQSSVVNLLMALQECYPFTGNDTYLLKTPYLFDVSVTELFGWTLAGGGLFILKPGSEKDPQEILKAIEKHKITHINFVPSMFRMFIEVLTSGNIGKLSGLKYIFLAGEALLPELVKQFRRLNTKIVLENLYGPTEGTVYASRYSLSQWDERGSVPIGKPLQSIRLYILNKNHHLQPVGVPGELYISGVGLARGYLNRPQLTAEKFLSVSYGSYKSYGTYISEKIYRTGDLARWLWDGNIEFLGRIDHQVKIRGFRIELGEIEECLEKHEVVIKAVVAAKEDNQMEKSLIAFVVASGLPEQALNKTELKKYLSQQLPDYMVPSTFVLVEEIPVTTSGKVDRKALLSREAMGTTLDTAGEYVAPKSDMEKLVVDIWKEVLDVEKIGIYDNLFEVGGNSLKVIRLASKLQEAFKQDIPVVKLFKYPTVDSLLGYLRKNQGEDLLTDDAVKAVKGFATGGEIAVIGMAARFPGAKNIHQFWENLKNGVESITFLSKKEQIESGMDPELVNHPDYIPAKGILEDKDHFDSFFFGYTPAEAEIMDPQVRIFHECCWEALEDGGYDPETYAGLIGLYAGASPNPYWEILPLKSHPTGHSYAELWDAVQFSDKDYLSTRIAYKLDLKGPCVTMQTACSTSLVVVDLACQGLLSGTSDIALAGGVSVTLNDQFGYLYQEGTIMSPDGHCRTFDARANGTVGGNGAGVVVLKRLEEALKDRNSIYAVIKGYGINNDGKNKVGFTAPSVEGQAGAIRAAQRMAGIEPESIGYVEAHGTGTSLGDPIEIEALKQAFGTGLTNSAQRKYCALGSVKTNIGHLDAAAGIAGLIKTVLMLKHRFIPPTIHFFQPSPAIDFGNSPFYVNTQLKPWRNDGYPLRAGVSSFGLGGTNAHVILEEAPLLRGQKTEDRRQKTGDRGQSQARGKVPLPSREYQFILLSAKTPFALDRMTENLANHLKKNPGINLADVAYTLKEGRKAFPHRKMLVCPGNNVEKGIHALESGTGETGVAKNEKLTIIFMFSGQGSQYVNMGLDLYKTEPLFRDQVDYCFQYLEKITGIDMKSVLYPDLHKPSPARPGQPRRSPHSPQEGSIGAEAEEKINQFLYTTPIKFIFEYSLAALLMKWGICPDAMIGHSFGEYAAACLSGVFSLEDALFLAALRGELMHGLPGGAMLSVPLAEKQLKPLLADKISLAAVNGESMCVVSGPVDAIDAFEGELNEKGHECLRYHVPKAGHSWMVEPILAEFKEKIKKVKFNQPQIPYISGLTGKWITPEAAMNPVYWTRHLRETVRFADGLTTLFKEPNPVFLQVGPGRGLTLFVNQHPAVRPGTPTVNMVRHRKEKVSDSYYTLNKIGQLWLYGVPIDGQIFYPDQKRYRIPLPTYPFEGNYYNPPKDLLKISADRSSAKPLLTHKADISDWFYVPVWEQSPLTLTAFPVHQSRKRRQSFNWLVFTDDLGLGTRLVKLLRKTAREVVTVKVGEVYAREGENSYRLDPGQVNDYNRLFHELRESGTLPDRIIHLWSVMHRQKLKPGLQGLDKIQELGFYSLFYMVQALGRQDISREIHINVVTNNMQSVTGEEDTWPEKATIRGAVKIIPLEYVNINCTSIDILLPAPGPGSQIEDKLVHQLLKQLMSDTNSQENIIALRGTRRWCETMKPCRLEKTESLGERLREKGVYLITGGLGGMGFTFARYLAENFKAKLILVGRSFFPAREDWPQWLVDHTGDDKVSVKIRRIQELEDAGAEILVCSADVSNEQQMRAVIAQTHQRFGPINGVFHTAGVGDYAGMIQQRTREMTEKVMAPKVRGTLVLDTVLKDDHLDILVLFSSIGNIIYQVKFAQVGYNAANEFLEAFAYFKTRKDGAYTVTINWNDWLEVGMSIEATHRKYRKHWKYKTREDPGDIDYESAIHAGIKPTQGIEVMERVLSHTLERVTVSRVDLNEMVRVLRGLKKKDSSTFEAVEKQAASLVVQQRPPLSTPYAAPANPLEEALGKIWSNYFGIAPIGTEDDFFELGGDSLKAMIITQKIHQQLEVRIPLADFFHNPTIKGQAGFIHKSEKKIYSSISPAEKKEYYALSSAQRRIYILHQMEEDSMSYNITHAVMLEGELDRKRLQETFFRLIQRHESLRTSFHMVGNQPVQKIHQNVEPDMEYDDMKEVEVKVEGKLDRANHHSSFIIHHFIRPFDLSRAPLLRVGLVELQHTPTALGGHPSQEGKENKYLLMVDMHHIISDGASVDVLTMEFTELYGNNALPGLRLQYKDYWEWQRRQKGEKVVLETVKKQEAYWLNQLAGELPVLELPLDYPRPAVQSFSGNSQIFEIGLEETKQLKALALERETTLFTVLLALCHIWLSKLSGQEDIILGTVTAGRKFEDLQSIIGMFVNTLVLRNFTGGEKTCKEFIDEVRERTLTAFENQDYPFEDLVEKVALKRDTSGNPLFDVMFTLQSRDRDHVQIPGLTVKPCDFETGISKFDLSLEGVEQENQLQFTVEFCTDLFKPETIRRWIKYFKKVVSSVIENPHRNPTDIEIILKEEKEQILYVFNNTNTAYPSDKTIHQLFEEQVEKTPDNIAVVGPLQIKYRSYMTYMTYISYRELNEKSNQLAFVLREKGVAPDTIAAIMVGRSVEMIIGILGILKTGGAYLPIDPEYPEERRDYMLSDSNVGVLLTTPKLQVKVKTEVEENFRQLRQLPLQLINIESEFAPAFEPSPSTLTLTSTCQVRPTNLAYIIYTSGSTGKPKGVMANHTNVLAYVNAYIQEFQLGPTDIAVLESSFSFDAFAEELYSTLLIGGKICIVEKYDVMDVYLLKAFIEKNNVTIMSSTPLTLNELNRLNSPAAVRTFVSGTDVLKGEHVDRLSTLCKVYNAYGPTETTVCAAYYKVSGKFKSNLPIGKPISNYQIYITDKNNSLQAVGVIGQIWIGGAGVTRGYLNNPELTFEKFINYKLQITSYKQKINQKLLRGVRGGGFLEKSPPGRRRQKIYKTGDLGRWLPDGNIEFLGRVDYQVKIRGYRIEPGEIETRLLNHAGINEAVVLPGEEEGRNKYLCAYLVMKADKTFDRTELREHLTKVLPGYMVPGYFIKLDKIPLTPGGKIDRKALPAPGLAPVKAYAAPRDEVEKRLVEIWEEVLDLNKDERNGGSDQLPISLGIDDNFFELGGHSLKATILTSKIHQVLQVKVPLVEVFKRLTIRGLSKYIKTARKDKYDSIEAIEKREYYGLSSAQERLYFLQQLDLNSTSYNMPLVLPVGKDIDKHDIQFALKRLIARHESLRTSFMMMLDEPVQRVHDEARFQVEYYDLQGTDASIDPTPDDWQLATSIIKNFIRPFDLSRAPLARSGLIKCSDNTHIWMIDIHHIVSDGTSHAILAEDFVSFYQGEVLAPLRLQYKDFSQWQNRLFTGSEIKAQEDYWLGLYPDPAEIPRLHLPADYKRPEVFTFAGDNYRFKLEAEEAGAFKAVGSAAGATLYMNLLATLNTLFYKTTGQTDIIIGSGIAGRPHADLQPIIGMFVNSLAMRNYPGGEKPYVSFLKEVMAHSIKAFENQDVQFEELVEKLDPERDPSRNPLFDIALVVQNFRQPQQWVEPVLNNKNLPKIEFKNKTSKFDITFFVDESGEELDFTIEFYTGIFKEETIRRLTWHFKNIIRAVIKDPSVKLKDIEIISTEEKHRILEVFNDTVEEYPGNKTIHWLFREQVEQHPDKTALVYGEEVLTYKDLDNRASQLAGYLYNGKGVRPEDRVGLLMTQPVYQAAALLGILEAGSAYVPMDSSLPEERLKYLIDDAAVGIVISEKRYVRMLNRLQWECRDFHSYLCLDSRDIHNQEEQERSELMNKELWHHVGETASNDITGGGWISSYTGEPLSREEMDEYGDNILKKLEPLLHHQMRVLEIGCASGITMYRIAPRVGLYYGTDLSSVIIQKNKKQVQKKGFKNIKLSCLAAHDIDQLQEGNFDLIIMNSVIQCFHGHNYLRKVIGKSIDLLGGNGWLFIGDIMDQEKKGDLVRELEAFKDTHRNENYTTKTDLSSELFISKGFWRDLGAERDEIEDITFSDKIFTIENELTKFRYDVLVTINKHAAAGQAGNKAVKKQKLKHQEDSRVLLAYTGKKYYLSTSSDHLAYIIYTSGTTGQPRGVEVAHRGVVNTLLYRKDAYGMNDQWVSLQLFSYGFDGFVTSFFTPLVSGSKIVLLEKEEISDIEKIRDVIVKQRVSHFISVPALYAAIIETLTADEIFSLKSVTLAGDQLSEHLLAQTTAKSDTLEIVNEYGITESSVLSTIYRHQERDRIVKIGQPIRNTQLYILDEARRLQPIGVTGELCISGVGLARGYLNNPELTAQKFLTISSRYYRSYMSYRTNIIYKTGDLARWFSDGNIEFLGRIDFQVKIRGFRIEPGEIENRLLKHQRIKEAVVIARKSSTGTEDQYLCAYIVPLEGEETDALPGTKELKQWLSQTLPAYMVPSYVVNLEKIPLTPTGKVDRKALPEPCTSQTGRYAAPGNNIEKQLAQVWSDTLSLSASIGIDDNFFDLGGHSLKATILVGRIHKVLGVKIPLAEVFKTPTIRGLAAYIGEKDRSKYQSIKSVEKREYYALSSAQKRLFLLQQMNAHHTAYNIPAFMSLQGPVDLLRLETVFKKIITRHEILRTSMKIVKGEPVQEIHQDVEFKIEYIELAAHSSQPAASLISSFIRPFDFSQAPLLRVALIGLQHTPAALRGRPFQEGKENQYILMLDMHHVISDGWSIGILIDDFTGLYQGKGLSPLQIQYKDYAQWQGSEKEKGAVKKQEEYWSKQFTGEMPLLDLPYDYVRPAVQDFSGSRVNFRINQEETRALNFLAQGDVTLYMVLLAIYYVLLSKVSGEEDIIVGSPTAGRRHPDLEQIIGMLVNTLALRNRPRGENPFNIFLEELKENVLAALENQDYPFEELVEHTAVNRDIGRNPLFDVMFSLLNIKIPEIQLPGLKLTPYEYQLKQAKFDITLSGVESEQGLLFYFEYCTQLFKEETLQRLINYFKQVVREVLQDPGKKIKDIEIMGEIEKQELLYDFNPISTPYPKYKTLHELFAEQVERTPDNTALVGPMQVKNRTYLTHMTYISYRELNERSHGLAYLLQEKGVAPDTIVGIMVERSVEMIIGILGILKSGGAYMPIDPEYPEERVNYMLADSGAEILVTIPGLSEKFKKLLIVNCQLLIVNEMSPNRRRLNTSPQGANSINNLQLEKTDLAYIIYTSGSTGKPKGVLVEHFSVVNLAFSQKRQFNITAFDRILQFSSICFDASVEQVFISLFSGAVLVLVDKYTLLDKKKFEAFTAKQSITHIHAVPSFLNTIGLKDSYQLKRIIAGGDVCPPALAKKLSRYCDFYNEYGPTETTVTSIEIKFAHGDVDETLPRLPVGKPISNTVVYVLGKGMELIPAGAVGELYIGGEGVARGYLNRPELTADKFCLRRPGGRFLKKLPPWTPHKNFLLKLRLKGTGKNYMQPCNHATMLSPHHPIPPIPHSPIYQTGDLVRWLRDGNIEFLGRVDHQVKIRGFRIEPGEIENQLLNLEEIKNAVVIAREEPNSEGGGEQYVLCAYVVADREFEPTALREYLSRQLPDYMIPSYFMQLKQVPLTPSGKIDRRALPEPEIKTGNPYVAPVNEIEKQLLELWKEVLVIPRAVGINDNFFELGGHSLKAAVLISKIHQAFHVNVPLVEMFKTPTIKGLSRYIKEAAAEAFTSIEPVEKREYYELSSAQKRLYILQHFEPGNIGYNVPSAVVLEGVPDRERFEETFLKLNRRHESFRTSFVMNGNSPVQRVHDKLKFEIEYNIAERKAQSAERKEEHCAPCAVRNASTIKDFIRPFDLSQAPLIRVELIKLHKDKYALILDMHHIISDGTSAGIFVKEFMTLYAGEALAPLKVQYKDFSLWQQGLIKTGKIKTQEAYWLNQLKGEVPVLNLPYDYPRPLVLGFEGDRLNFEIEQEQAAALRSLALKEGATLYMVLLSIYHVLLSKLSGQEEIVVGIPLAGRRHADLQQVFGMFVNTLVLSGRPIGEKTFKQFLEEIKQSTLTAYENQEYPFEDLVEKAALNRDASRNPLFDVMFALQNTNMEKPELEIPGLKLKPYEFENKISKFDLTLLGYEAGQTLNFTLEYRTKLFKEETIHRFIGFFKKIVSVVLDEPGKRISGIDIISEPEKRQLLVDFNDSEIEYPEDKTIHGLFAEQVERTPDNTALVGPMQVKNRTHMTYISYRELDERSHRLAYLLQEKGVAPDTIVSIMVERSVEMIIGILGILKAGGAYMPIDPEYPEERIDYILSDSNASMLLTHKDIAPSPSTLTLTSTCQVSPTNLAYIIYTSGTTGKPKGTLIQHQNVVRLLFNNKFQFDFSSSDVWTLFHSYCFDFSVWEMYGALLYGGQLIIIPKTIARDSAAFLNLLEKKQVTVLNQTPGAFYHLVDEACNIKKRELNLEYVIFGGEALMPAKLKQWKQTYPEIKLINMFGITETTVHVTFKEIGNKEIEQNISNIGKPIPTLNTYIVDKYLQWQPIGVPGELCVGGDGVCRGYLNNPELTTDKFLTRFNRCYTSYRSYISNPIYKSGDLVRRLANGELEYLGRIDHQVKIRGFRIELGEIENQLLKHQNIKEAVVLLKDDRQRMQRYLCAYFVPADKITLSVSGLREYLSKGLPDYMIPAYFVQVEKIPLTSNGKVDREALVLYDTFLLSPDEKYVAPGTDMEKTMSGIWKEVLQLERIGIDDNFFEIGGNSLNVVQVNKKLNQVFGSSLPVVDMFRYVTIRSLARVLEQQQKIDYPDIDRKKRAKAVERGKSARIQRHRKKMEQRRNHNDRG